MGAALAAKELGQGQRTILFIGDGSFQLTAQELSVMIRSKLNVIIFLIENNGYTIEKFIHGEKADYNQIARWDYSALTKAFGGTPESTTNYEARTTHELEEVLKNETVINGQGVRFITVFMPESDAPRALKKTAKASADLNAKN